MAELMNPSVLKKVSKELADLSQNPPAGIRVYINEQNLADIQAEIDGPEGSPYEGGSFRMKLMLTAEYPQAPPKGYFITKCFHPNVSASGEICVNVLKKDWNPEMGLRHVLVVVKCLLVDPNPESALNEEAGRLLLEDYEEFARHARLMTSIHAQSKRVPGPLTTSGGNVSGANAAAGGADGGKQAGEGGSSPATKKAKPAEAATKANTAAAKVKKSLKRL